MRSCTTNEINTLYPYEADHIYKSGNLEIGISKDIKQALTIMARKEVINKITNTKLFETSQTFVKTLSGELVIF